MEFSDWKKQNTAAKESGMTFDQWQKQNSGQRISSEPVNPQEQMQFYMASALDEMLRSGEIEAVDPSFMGKLKRNWPQYAGGVVGGLAGAATFGPDPTDLVTVPAVQARTAKFFGALGGAAIGGMGGKGYQQLYRMKSTGKIGTMSQIYGEQAVAGLEELAGELSGQVIGAGMQLGLKGASKIASKAFTPQARITAKELNKVGSHATLAQLTDSRLIDITEAIAEGSILGGGRAQTLHLRSQPEAAKQIMSNMIDQFASGAGGKLTPTQTGQMVQSAIKGNDDVLKLSVNALYKHLDKLTNDSPVVDMRPLKKWAADQSADLFNIAPSQMGDTMLTRLAKVPDDVTFTQAERIRASLIAAGRSASKTSDTSAGVIKKATQLTHQAIDGAGPKLDPGVLPAWNKARQAARVHADVFNNEVIYKLSKKQPQAVINELLKPENVVGIKAVKMAADDAWPTIKYGMVGEMVRRSTSTGQKSLGTPMGHRLLTQLDRYGPEMLNEVFTKQELKALKNAATALSVIQRPTQEFAGTGRMVIALTQASALGVGAWQRSPGAMTGIVAGPYAIGRIMTSPKWTRILAENPKTPQLTAALTGRLLMAYQGYVNEYEEKQAREPQRKDGKLVPKEVPSWARSPQYGY